MKRTLHIWGSSCLFWIIALIPPNLSAESGKMNVHLELGPSFAAANWQLKELGPGAAGNLAFELSLKPWLGVQLQAGYFQFFGVSSPDPGYEAVDKPYLFLTGLGARFRPLNDEKGYLRPWKKRPDHTGNLWGNLFVDISVNYALTGGLHRLGASAGLGYEFSLFDALQIGPFVRGVFVYQPEGPTKRDSEDAWIVTAGLSFSLAIPTKGMHMADTDGDGIYDPMDKCPKLPEDKDGFEDGDGCPDADNDGDGIRDEADECPLEPEDFDGFEDANGCPESDNDLDGLPDAKDACPDEREDFDQFKDDDGCPDVDNDNDHIADDVDQCPNEPETVNQIQDEDGCPEADADKDGVFDEMDMCPDAAETINGIEDEDGCPDEGLVEVQNDQILLGERIFFDFNLARIRTRGKAVLDQLAELLKVHPEYAVISIEGHADRKGNPKANERISTLRAERVKAYIVSKGVSPSRLRVKGFGAGRPWVPYNAAEDAAKNRRVEVVIEEIDNAAHMAESVKSAVNARGKGTETTNEAEHE